MGRFRSNAYSIAGFHHRVARRISGLTAKFNVRSNSWEYPPIEDALSKAGLYTVEEYITRRQNTLAEAIACRPILDLCLESERLPGSSSR